MITTDILLYYYISCTITDGYCRGILCNYARRRINVYDGDIRFYELFGMVLVRGGTDADWSISLIFSEKQSCNDMRQFYRMKG